MRAANPYGKRRMSFGARPQGCIARTAGCIAAVAAAVQAQSIENQSLEELRQQLSNDLRQVHFVQSLLGLVLLSYELELSGGSYSINDAESTSLSSLSLPCHTDFQPWGAGAPRVYFEGSLGYADAKQSTQDIYNGSSPLLQTSVTTHWRTYGAVGGLGIAYPLRNDLTFTPIVNAAIAHIENRSDYGGPGANLTAALADGIAFNWDALALTYGAAARLDWQHQLNAALRCQIIARYDLRFTDTVQTDDVSQEFFARSQLLTLRTDLFGPANMTVFKAPLDWQLTLAYRYFPEVTLFGVRDYFEVGASVLANCGDSLPLVSALGISTTAFFGEDFTGWTIGVRMTF